MTLARITTLTLSLLAILGLSACGPSKAELQPREGAKIFAYTDGTINGAAVKVATATKAIDRARLYALVDFAGEQTNAAVLVFGAKGKNVGEDVLSIVPDFGSPADLVFINKAKKVVSVHDYIPAGVANARTGYESVGSWYNSEKPASIAVFVNKGKAAEMKLSVGADVAMNPDVFGQIDSADPDQLKLFFRPRYLQNTDREDIPKAIEMNVRVAMTAEDRARGLIEGDEALLMLYRDSDTTWQRDGFWLKGHKGKVSFAFMHLKQQGGVRASAGTAPMSGYVQDLLEGVEDSGSDDISRSRWWPSVKEVRMKDSITGLNATGPVNAILVLPSEKGLSGRGIEKDMWVLSTSITLAGIGRVDDKSSLVEKNDLSKTMIMVGSKKAPFDLVQKQGAIDAAANSSAMLSDARLKLIAWDSPARASITKISGSPNSVALLKHKSGNLFNVESIVMPNGKIDAAPSRFALMGQFDELKQGAEVQLPWQVVNLRPMLETGAFYSAKTTETGLTTFPASAKAKVWLEVAQTEPEIAQGLMFRTSLPENQGMVFKFAEVEAHEFWMKNCKMDIDVAFINEDGKIVALHEMKPEAPGTLERNYTKYRSGVRVKFAVEMAGGWFKANNVQKGDYFWMPVAMQERN